MLNPKLAISRWNEREGKHLGNINNKTGHVGSRITDMFVDDHYIFNVNKNIYNNNGCSQKIRTQGE